MKKIINNRETFYDVAPVFPNRWSPRALTGESISDEELMQLFEAARWAPSSYNNQPWRFIYAKRNTENWEKLFNLLGEFNQTWCQNAAALILIISKKTFEHNGQISVTHAFDTGSAWQSLALQASISGWVAHGMQGFDYEKARVDLDISDDFNVEAMAAIGKQAGKETLPEAMQENEVQSGRKLVEEFVSEGNFKW